MNKADKTREKLEEELFAALMQQTMEEEGRRILEEIDQKKGPVVPEEVSQRCKQVIHQQFASEERPSNGGKKRRRGRVIRRVALVAAAAVLTVSLAFAGSPSIRQSAMQLFLEMQGESASIQFVPVESSNSNNDTDGLSNVRLPAGFELDSSGKDSLTTWALYYNDSGDYIDITLYQGSGASYNFDTETSVEEDVEINQHSAVYTEKDAESRLMWVDEEKEVVVEIVSSGITQEDLFWLANELVY